MTTKEIGNIGEEFTEKFLISKGCEILARNFTIRGGEIDIIAKKGELIHFVEVKARKRSPLETGDRAITQSKIKHIVRTAQVFLSKFEIESNCVFDVAIVEVDNGKVTDFKYIQRAFTA
ncbi:MAG: YraN family protein [Oscillospiraceae bacterium]|nr:YraN family protein [Oscillospiraceae bacterium]